MTDTASPHERLPCSRHTCTLDSFTQMAQNQARGLLPFVPTPPNSSYFCPHQNALGGCCHNPSKQNHATAAQRALSPQSTRGRDCQVNHDGVCDAQRARAAGGADNKTDESRQGVATASDAYCTTGTPVRWQPLRGHFYGAVVLICVCPCATSNGSQTTTSHPHVHTKVWGVCCCVYTIHKLLFQCPAQGATGCEPSTPRQACNALTALWGSGKAGSKWKQPFHATTTVLQTPLMTNNNMTSLAALPNVLARARTCLLYGRCRAGCHINVLSFVHPGAWLEDLLPNQHANRHGRPV
jgi:hypothetical protein